MRCMSLVWEMKKSELVVFSFEAEGKDDEAKKYFDCCERY